MSSAGQTIVLRAARQVDFAISKIQGLPVGGDELWELVIRPHKSQRSLSQNRLLWVWNNAIQKHLADHFGQVASAEEWHDILVSKLMPAEVRRVQLPDGDTFKVGRTRTSQLKVDEMTEYLTRLDAYCVETLNLQLPHPMDLMMEAMNHARCPG